MGEERRLASHIYHAQNILNISNTGRPKQPEQWAWCQAGADGFASLALGVLAQTGLKSHATAPLDVH